MIREIFNKSRNIYGTRRIADQLAKRDIFISRNRIVKLMALAGLSCKTTRKFKVTTDSKHNKPISPNLLNREFNVIRPLAKRFHKFSNFLNYSQIFPYQTQSPVFAA